MEINFKGINFQLTGDIFTDTNEFIRLCDKKDIKLSQTKFLKDELKQRLGNVFVLYLHEEIDKKSKRYVDHYIFITSVVWSDANEKSLIKFWSEILSGSGHDGIRALLYLYSHLEPSKNIIKYVNWSHT